MKSLRFLIGVALVPFLLCGCTSSDDETTAPEIVVIGAGATFTNLLVGDGTVDTRMSVRIETDMIVVEGILPNESSTDNTVPINGTQESIRLRFYLTTGPGEILNAGQQFLLDTDRDYLFVACGDIDAADGDLQPKLIMLTPMASPGVGRAQFRFVHALAGNPVAVDVHVNGQVISNVAYGTNSTAVVFDARPLGQDEMSVVPTGVVPDGTNEIWKSSGQILFPMDSHTDGVLTHHARSAYDGDLGGEPILIFVE